VNQYIRTSCITIGTSGWHHATTTSAQQYIRAYGRYNRCIGTINILISLQQDARTYVTSVPQRICTPTYYSSIQQNFKYISFHITCYINTSASQSAHSTLVIRNIRVTIHKYSSAVAQSTAASSIAVPRIASV
jgi:hypothetical protein